MEKIATFADIVTLLLTALMCVSAAKRWKRSEKSIFFYVFVFFYVVPLFLDYLCAFPDYSYSADLYGFKMTYMDPLTRVIYDCIILLVQWMLLHLRIKTEKPVVFVHEEKWFKQIKKMLYVGIFSAPVMTLLFGSNKAILYTFMWRENELAPGGYLPVAERLSYVGICCAVVLFFLKTTEHRFERRLISLLLIYVNVCIEGKRSITFFLLLVVFIVMFPGILDRSISLKSRRRRMVVLAILLMLCLTIMVIFTITVKMENRGYAGFGSVYTTLRIDFFRDDRVRMAIYSMLYPQEMTILTYPGQTLIPAILHFFPLDYIFGFMGVRQPMAYTAYISAALRGSSMVSQQEAFMTPAIFAELLSNFHVIGIILFIAVTLWCAKQVRKYPYPANVFIIISYAMLQTYSIAYMSFLLEATVIMCVLCRVRFVRRRGMY